MKLICKFLIIVSTCFIFGCNPKYYVPNTQNVPVIAVQGEVDATVSGNENQQELQLGYGLTDNVAIQLNGARFAPSTEDNGDGGSGRLIEAGIGYYKDLQPSMLFSVFGLVGIGSVKNQFPRTVDDHPETAGVIEADIFRYGVQPILTYHMAHFSISGSARLMHLNYSNMEGSLIFGGEDQIAYLNDHDSHMLLEPGITVRGGFEKIKLQIQFLHSFNLTNPDFRQDDNLITAGINFRF